MLSVNKEYRNCSSKFSEIRVDREIICCFSTTLTICRLCDPIDPGHTKKTDILNLYETLASNLAGIVQYNKDNRPRSPTRNITVDDVCNNLVDETIGIPVERLAYVNNMILNATKEKCLDYRYGKMIRELRNITWSSEQAEGGNLYTSLYISFKLLYCRMC